MARALSAGQHLVGSSSAHTGASRARGCPRYPQSSQRAARLPRACGPCARLRTFARGAVRLLTLAAGLCAGAAMAQKKPPPG